MKNIIAAFQFLTILAIPVNTLQKHLEKSMVWYPAVGAVIGIITGYGYQLFSQIFPANISATLTILLYIITTRGLHLDGFMDTIDGFFSHKNKKDADDILRIMKDPTVGSFAVLGIITWFFLLFNTLPLLKPQDHILIHTFSRLAILLMPLLYSYPRQSGTGKFFVDNVKPRTFLFSVILSFIIGLIVVLIKENKIFGMNFAKSIGIWWIFIFLSLIISMIIGFWAKKKISGITGDILGFTIETIHIILALFVLIVPYRI